MRKNKTFLEPFECLAYVKCLIVHHYSAGYILLPLGSLSHPGYFENRRPPLKLALGGVCSLANYSVAYEETQSNRVSDFRDFVCSLFPKAILYSTVAGVVPHGGRKKSPRT